MSQNVVSIPSALLAALCSPYADEYHPRMQLKLKGVDMTSEEETVVQSAELLEEVRLHFAWHSVHWLLFKLFCVLLWERSLGLAWFNVEGLTFPYAVHSAVEPRQSASDILC